MSAIDLKRTTLSSLPDTILRPGYDPAAVTPGIVHLGLGGFHRAHMARYIDELIGKRPDQSEWGIAGAILMPGDRRMADSLIPQDGLYTLVERTAETETVRVIGSIVRVLFTAEDSDALLAQIDQPGVRIVSLTVTEHGYCLNRSTKVLDPEHPQIVRDLTDPTHPHSAPAIIVEAYRRRRDSGAPAFTALSCDNIQHNGNVLREAVLSFARLREPALADWINANASFPNTMVDRITPVTKQADIDDLRERYGIADRWPVFCEGFTQWVVEDRFVQGRPALEDVGAQFVEDVTPYEFMKLRLLNGSHLAVAGLGRLIGTADTTIDEALASPIMQHYMAALMDRETGPTLRPVPGIELDDYKQELVERFANPGIRDTVERVNTDAPLNVLVDPIRDRLASGESIDLLALALAAWIRRIRGEDEQGQPIEIKHPLAEVLKAKAAEGGADPRPVLGIGQLFGELGDDPVLIDRTGHWLASLYEVGAKRTLEHAAATLSF